MSAQPSHPDSPSAGRAQPGRRRGTLAVVVAALVVGLALVESTVALLAPARAPVDADWRAAAARVNAGFQAGDLIVAAPAWADPVLRMHLGDRLPARVAGRLDHQIYGRVWEISQRGASAPEVADGRLAEEHRFGPLRVRRFERPALALRYDFTERWADAQVARDTGAGPAPCERQPTQHLCPPPEQNLVRPAILEIGGSLRRAISAPPVAHGTVVLEYPGVRLGRELAVGAGLHNVWLRKVGSGTVRLRVLVDGRELGAFDSGNRTGWKVTRLDTSARAGRIATVRFEISSANPFSRHFGFAAEARG